MSADQWGRADADGTVYVRTADGERVVGQYPGATQDDALAYFARKYEDLAAQVSLLEQRLRAGHVSPQDASTTIKRLRPAIETANAVGDLAGLITRLDALGPVAAAQREQVQKAKQEAREAAIAARAALVDEAEALSGVDAERIPWKVSGDRLRVLFDEWRALQKDSRLDKSTEDEFWRRFSHARTTFDRKRRHYFGALDEQRAAARQQKEALVTEAEALSASTDWAGTATAFRDLMARWKQAGRASHREDDTLWTRFRSAQDAFFAARQAATSAVDAEFAENLTQKEALLAQAEALLPVTDLAAAKSALREIQGQWDAAGKVPRGDVQRVEGRMRKVETAIRDAEQDRWKKSNPEARARAEDLVAQLEQTIAGLEKDLAKAQTAAQPKAQPAAQPKAQPAAQAAASERKIRDIEAALDARREWLAQAQQALEEFAG